MGLKKVDRNVPTYQLMAQIFEQLDIHSGTVFNYHQERRQTENYLSDLELLQYDMLYGEKYIYGGKENAPEIDGEFRMGVLDVTLEKIGITSAGTYTLYGQNMTEKSKVFVNGDKQSSKFYNDSLIEILEVELKEGDIITVSQMGSSNTVFWTSEEYVYSEQGLVKASEYVPPVEEISDEVTDVETP